jgi:2-polyprenyl-3-methyl-5-hydroxy-6-metoxy-1,4-benzoquinol methylase
MKKLRINSNLKDVEMNQLIHDNNATLYNLQHTEIYNQYEQDRIKSLLKKYVNKLKNISEPIFLDFGSGTGNISHKLLKLGVSVVAADISENSLTILKENAENSNKLKTVHIKCNLEILFQKKYFDCIVIYSVLHHLPGYISDLKLISSLVKNGGFLIIDHEAAPAYWLNTSIYKKYSNKILQQIPTIQKVNDFIRKIFSYSYIIWKFQTSILRQSTPGPEGDIHVHKFDHINWSDIEESIKDNFQLVEKMDYLVCREKGTNPVIWKEFKNQCVDMRYSVFKKYR